MTSFNRHQSTGTLLSGSLFDPMKASMWQYVWGEGDIKEIIFTSQTSYFQSSVKVSYKIYICVKTECLLWIYQNAKDHVPVQLFANVWKTKVLRRKNLFFCYENCQKFYFPCLLTGWNYFTMKCHFSFKNSFPSEWWTDKSQDHWHEIVWPKVSRPHNTSFCWAWNDFIEIPQIFYTKFCDACSWKFVLGIPGVRKLGNLK